MILTRPRLIAQERFDLEDLNVLLSSARTDANLYTKEFLSTQNLILKGFSLTGIGLHVATMIMADATLIIPQSSTDYSYYIASPSEANITIPASELTDGVRNYVELSLVTTNGTPLTRAFWDPEANSGAGAEFNQQVDTVADLSIVPIVLTGGFSGLPDRLQVGIMDVDGSGVIKTIFDRRELFFRLGKPENIYNVFSFNSRTEPSFAANLTGVTGTFQTGEALTVNTETATCVAGGTTSIAWNLPSGINYFPGSTVTGVSSGASGTISTVQESFSGADKDLGTQRDLLTALMTEVKLLKGTPFWYSLNNMSANGVAQMINSVIFASSTASAPKFIWSGSYLEISDSNPTPTSTDVLAGIKLFGSSGTFNLLRQDGTASTSVINIPDGSVLFVQLPTSGSRSYSGVGTASTNYQVATASAFAQSDQNYWIAYRNGATLYIRGQSELASGESSGIGDSIPATLLQNIGLVDEVTPPNYSSNIRGSSGESIVSRVGVLTSAVGDEQEDRSGYLRSDSLVSWDGTNLTFTSPLVLEFVNTKTGTVTQHSIPTTASPMVLNASGQSVYAVVDRSQTAENLTPVNSSSVAIPAQTQATKNLFVFFRRVDAGGVAYLHIPFMKQLIGQGQSVRLGQSGAGGTIVRSNFYDNVTTTLPTGTSYTADGVAIANGQSVLFSNLSSGNNEVYVVSGVGTSLSWSAQHVFTNGGVQPVDGDQILILGGNGFANQVGTFDGLVWHFNDKIRLFNGSNYWEMTSINTASITDNTTATIFTVGAVGSENIVMNYSVLRAGRKETGTLYITQNDTAVSLAQVGAYLTAYTGITFSAAISSGNLILSYTSDSQGVGGSMKYYLQRWSDVAGGPGGPPSYSVPTGMGGTGAAGATGNIQFNVGAGTFGADSRFNWDASDGALNLNGALLDVLSSAATLLDNQSSPQTILTFDQTLYQFATIEYSIRRGSNAQVGRLMIVNNGTSVNVTDDNVFTSATGITFSVALAGGVVQLNYVSTNTGSTGTFKCIKRRWS
jgi:hypothetical protein